jgi:cellobiose-specific phosphotransferase system component IIA
MSTTRSVRDLVGALDRAIREALAATCPDPSHDPLARATHAKTCVVEALDATRAGDFALPPAALACLDAACEHLEYGELLEARTLLTAARSQLAAGHRTPGRDHAAAG